ncbi:MAG: hypothetical protein ABR888_01620 [Thermoplasmata archaeon]|jgi:hypothetical protein|nr:hypothetical protein [Thermoplasmata archaeon]
MSPTGDGELFVAGEPDSGVVSLQKGKTTVFDRVVDTVLPFGGRVPISRSSHPPGDVPPAIGEADPSLTEDRPWHLPRQQLLCVDMVLRAARRQRRTVTVVDVNRASAQQGLVDRWVGPNDVLPLLARADGSRLEGIEEFVPQKVRKFIGHR